MPLHLVPPAEPAPREKVLGRVKRQERPDGVLQCSRCGCRTVLNTENGVSVKNGRRKAGTKIDIDICAECYKRGIIVPMVTQLKST